jgi:short chain dehydrogenase
MWNTRADGHTCLREKSAEDTQRQRTNINHQARRAIVTGAAQGIGRRTVELLAEQKYALALVDLRSTADLARSLRSQGVEVMEFQGDFPGTLVPDQALPIALCGICARNDP